MSLLKLKSMAGIMPKNLVTQVVNFTPLSITDCSAFWNSVQSNPTEATRVLTELLNKIVELEKLSRSTGKPTAQTLAISKDLDRSMWMLVYTMRFIDLYFVVDSQDKQLRRAVTAYEAHRQEFRAVSATAVEAEQVIRALSRGTLEKHDTTNTLVVECTMVTSSAAVLSASVLASSDGQRDLSFSVLRDNSFVHLRLQAQILHGGESTRMVFEELLLQLESQIKFMRQSAALINSLLGNVMAVLHTLKEAIRSFPIMDIDLLKRAGVAVRGYMLWPLPYGAFARHVYELIEDEMRLPGSNLRERILAENPLLTRFGAEQAEKYGQQAVEWSRNHRVVAVMYNGNIPRASTMRKMIGRVMSKNYQPYLNELTTSREEMLVSIIETLLRNSTNTVAWRSSLIQTLRNKHATDLTEWYNKAMLAISRPRIDAKELIAVVKSMSPTLVDGIETRPMADMPLAGGGGDDDVFDSVHSTAKATSHNSKDPMLWNHTVPRLPQLFFEFLEIQSTGEGIPSSRRTRTEIGGSFTGAGPGGSDDQIFPGGKKSLVEGRAGRRNSKKTPAKSRMSITIPGLDIFSSNPAFDNSDAIPGAFGFHKCPQRYVLYGADYDELLRDVRALFPPDQTDGDDVEKTQALGQSKNVLRRVIMGGHDVLHRAVCIYVALRAMEPELCANVDFRFYLVPLGRNDLAAFLAQRDTWYRKNVYVPFHGPSLLLPLIKYTGADVIDLDGGGGGGEDSLPEQLSRQVSNPTPRHALSGAMSAFPKRPDSLGGGFGEDSVADSEALAAALEGDGEAGEDSGLKEIGHRLDANPSKLLRHLLGGYIRGGEVAWPVNLYDCECWESPDAIEMERGPDLTVPFCLRVEFGLGAAVAEHTSTEDFVTNFVGETSNEGLGPDFSLGDVLVDKSFIKAISGNPAPTKLVTPELNVCMFRMDVDGNLHAGHTRDIMELPDASYLSLVVASTPRMTFPLSAANSTVTFESFEPPATAANPVMPSIEVQTVMAKPATIDLIKKKDKKDKDVEMIKDSLRADSRTHHVGLVDVRASNSSRLPFNISVDGKVFGPYYRVRVRGSTALSKSGGQAMFSKAPHLALPIMSFTPLEAEPDGDEGRADPQRLSVFSV